MIIPRAKKEAQSELKFSLQMPLTVNTDADSEFAVEIISEMAPYLDPVHSEAFDSAVSIEIRPQISLKNEFYSISIKDNKIKIIAKDKRGVVNAIASLTQLVSEKNDKYYINETEIEDYPDKEFRSFMIDTGRKYIPLDDLRSQILSMAKAKMTKLHWHITDSQGCPVHLNTLPDMRSPDPAGRKYTKDEMRSIVDYAAKFMIDVIPEIDMPGHSFELVEYMPNLRCQAEHTEGWVICIGNEDSYKYIEDIFSELTEIFPYEYYHVGTDEIDMRDIKAKRGWQKLDWQNCSVCNEKFGKLGLTTVTERFYYFVKRVYNILGKLGKKMVMWNDNIDISQSPDLPRDILIEFWRVAGENRGPREGCSMKRFLDEGFTVINADYPNTYVDLYVEWNKLRSWNLTADPAEAGDASGLVIGAEACAWEVLRHYAFSLYTTIPAFADRAYNLSPITNESEFGTALTRIALGASVTTGFNMFDNILCDFILGYNDCNIFKADANLKKFKNTLTSLTAISKDQSKLISAYLELL